MIKLVLTCPCLPSLPNTLALRGSHQNLITYSLQTIACVGSTRGTRLIACSSNLAPFFYANSWIRQSDWSIQILMICTVLWLVTARLSVLNYCHWPARPITIRRICLSHRWLLQQILWSGSHSFNNIREGHRVFGENLHHTWTTSITSKREWSTI